MQGIGQLVYLTAHYFKVSALSLFQRLLTHEDIGTITSPGGSYPVNLPA